MTALKLLYIWSLFGGMLVFMRYMMWPESTTTFEQRMASAKWWEL